MENGKAFKLGKGAKRLFSAPWVCSALPLLPCQAVKRVGYRRKGGVQKVEPSSSLRDCQPKACPGPTACAPQRPHSPGLLLSSQAGGEGLLVKNWS